MSDTPSVDRWLAAQQEAVRADVRERLDVAAGLGEVLLAARHADLRAATASELDVGAGLAAILPARETRADPMARPVAELASVAAALARGERLADEFGRADVSERLGTVRAHLTDRVLTVAVVGEVRKGKSTLVNALLQADVAGGPVPVSVRFGDPATAPATDPAREVSLPHPLLRAGLALVDTPGLDGLQATHGAVALGLLGDARGMIFVTDALAPLSGVELDFLRRALERTPAAVCVVNKTDLPADWPEIVELNRARLAEAGLAIPVVAVSADVHRRESGLDPSSGFGPLLDWLRDSVVEAAVAEAVEGARLDLDFAREQLRLAFAVEEQALAEPELSNRFVDEVRARIKLTGELMAGARWRPALHDGMADLADDVRHDLQQRMVQLTRTVEGVIDQADPGRTWPTLDAWLQREVVLVVTAVHDEMVRRIELLADDVARSFALDSDRPLDLGLTAPADVVRGLRLRPLGPDGRRGPVRTIVAGLMMGAGRRQLLARREQAKVAARSHLDEVAFVAEHEGRDSLRRAGRELRDEFLGRAVVLHASQQEALRSVERAAAMTVGEREARRVELTRRRQRVDALASPTVAA